MGPRWPEAAPLRKLRFLQSQNFTGSQSTGQLSKPVLVSFLVRARVLRAA